MNDGVNLVISELPDLIFLQPSGEDRRSALSLSLLTELQHYLRFLPKVILAAESTAIAVEALRYDVLAFIHLPAQRVDFVKAVMKFDRCCDQPFMDMPVISKGLGVEDGYSDKTEEPALPESQEEELYTEAETENAANSELTEAASGMEVRDAIAVDKEKPLIICVKSYGDYRFINADDICYLKADNNSTDIHLNNGEMITAFKTLKHFENVLESPFVRIHNSYIVNIDYVSRIHTGNSVCYLKHNGLKLPFSKSYKENVDSILHSITKGNYLEI